MTPPLFKRTTFTWLAYFMLAFYAYLQAAPGPLMPFLREELGFDYTLSGLHFSAFALGMVLAAANTNRLARYFGRSGLFWGGGGGMVAGMLVFISAPNPILTLTGVFLMGFVGTFMLVIIQATLSDHHGEFRTAALTESNLGASISASAAPFLIGTLEGVGVGWRMALLLGGVGWLAVALFYRGTPIPLETPIPTAQSGESLPRRFWAYWGVLIVAVAVEWSIIYWGADFLHQNAELATEPAATAMTLYFLANALGRFMGSRLVRRFRLEALLIVTGLISLAGFLPFWLIPLALPALVGLFVAGLGIANLFPLLLSAASGSVTPQQSNLASGRVSMGAGGAMLVVPQVLGAVAEVASLQIAYALVGVLIFLILGGVLWANSLDNPME